MPAQRLHFVRHGEVFNPNRVLYGRIPGFGLSELGHGMARAAAEALRAAETPVTRLVVSPLQRTRESSVPWQELFGLEPSFDERVIEPWNHFEGYRMGPRAMLQKPSLIWRLRNPKLPTWGEPYREIEARMRELALDLWQSTPSGDAVVVSHQLPIWTLYRSAAGLELPHDPRTRRCSLSSVTSFEVQDGRLVPVDYREPGLEHAALASAPVTDGGAV